MLRASRERGEDLHPIPVRIDGVEAQVAGERRALPPVDVEAEGGQPGRQTCRATPRRPPPAPDGPCVPARTGRRLRRGSRRSRHRRRRTPGTTRRPEPPGRRASRPPSSPVRRRRSAARPPRRHAASRPGRGGASCRLPGTWATAKTRRKGSTTPYGLGGYAAREAALELLLERRAGRSGSAWSVGRAPVPETQVKTGSSPGEHVEVGRLPGVDLAAGAASASR